MRTTLTLDDDVADALKRRARMLDKPFKQVVNEALRRGLQDPEPRKRSPVTVNTFPGGLRPGIDPLKLNQLSDEIEIEEFLRKHG